MSVLRGCELCRWASQPTPAPPPPEDKGPHAPRLHAGTPCPTERMQTEILPCWRASSSFISRSWVSSRRETKRG